AISADTVYFGGGTPPLIGCDKLIRILGAVKDCFDILDGAEVTLELNPCNADADSLARLRGAGFNRISMGVQSGLDSELVVRGRKHSAEDVRRAVELSRKVGFDNVSLDLMLAVSGQTENSLRQSIDFIASCQPRHVSSYILKVEEGTPYHELRERLALPDDDTQARLYTLTCEHLEQHGYRQYEISNFALEGFESRHNLKYWDCGEYLGFGPSAHSFFGGRRFYYPRDIDSFISSPQTCDDGEGGDCEEYIMLRLRLRDGVREVQYRERYGEGIPKRYRDRAAQLASPGLVICDDDGIHLTREGMLLSNAVIAHILA
ncbi:MAG: radical SAM family heme chaperone HemW, partial [Clostridia bacterium]|nr:radical SAM family heme chaperone HemW [Clostridia bacterium]